MHVKAQCKGTHAPHTHIWAHILPIKLRKITKTKKHVQKCFRVLISWKSSAPILFHLSHKWRIWKHPSQNAGGSYQDIWVVLTQRVSPYVPREKNHSPLLVPHLSDWLHLKALEGSPWACNWRAPKSPAGWSDLGIQYSNQKQVVIFMAAFFFPGNGEQTAREFAAIPLKKWRDCSEMWMDRAGMQPSSRLIQSTGWNLRRVTNVEMQSEIVANIQLISRTQVNVMFLSSLLMTLSQWYITKPDPSLY